MKRNKNRLLVRDTDTGLFLELFLVMAVTTMLVNRAFLALTGYPQLSPGNLHIAHMLWGGLLMFIAIVLLLRYWNPSMRRLAAFIGGMGFGLFIDELGKFITNNNDYFYKPTIAVIYVIFILIYLTFKSFAEVSELSETELQANKLLRQELGNTLDSSSRVLVLYDNVRKKFEQILDRVLETRGIIPGLMVIFVVINLIQLGSVFGLFSKHIFLTESSSRFAVIGAMLSGILVFLGVLTFHKSLPAAFLWFKRAVLVSIFITQIFLFYHSQLTAIWGLAVDLLFYSAIETSLHNWHKKSIKY